MPAKRKSIEISIKQQAIEWIATEGGGVPSRAEAHFRKRGWRITASCFRQWWRDRDQILAEHGARRRIVGGGRRPLLGAVEDALIDLVYEKRIRKEKTPDEVVAKSVQACGFNNDSSTWRIAKHDVYGSRFKAAWELRERDGTNGDIAETMSAVMETLDDIVIED
ncbi:hypothetical protein PF002_g20132 [Phytophthora fragariae]|uniref:HTH CENPB-type domain-containing protein n=1 Tax=Phytophthora fragariae TaxID=53985 RepID=A0A6A3XP59_9STRA|nr:hypothetical protein PF002_g20132 [Phytophthora fragariae]